MKKKTISAALAGVLAVSLLSACGSSEPQNIADVSSTAASSEAASTTDEAAEPAAQEMTFVLNSIPDGLDPPFAISTTTVKLYKVVNAP